MGITALGHRKTILKEIENLRANKPSTVDLAKSASSLPTASLAELQDQPLQQSISLVPPQQEAPATQKVHWSALPPLSSQQESAQEEPHAVNLADGTYDEAGAHESFVQAVLAWRQAGKTSSQENENATTQENEAFLLTQHGAYNVFCLRAHDLSACLTN